MSRCKLTRTPPVQAVKKVHRVNLNPKIARRSFLKLSAATAALTSIAMTSKMSGKAVAAGSKQTAAYPGSKIVRTICSYCAVGCGIHAEVHNGVWVRQEVAQDHPVSRGGHCCKGAGAIDMVTSKKRLRHPMRKVNGKWQKLSWDQALDEICGKLLAIRENDGPDALHINGSAKVSTEMAYQQRKLAAFWGTNNVDHQARI